jgi:UDP-GlcNAc:undecaprenyl-phosphate/decaprenyl-phosphate GlcNAc-1-phosphate transferase
MHCPWLELTSWSWFNPALTVLWLLTAVNAFNFIDGLDGLAAGVGIISAITVAFLAISRGAPFVLVQALALAGALGGFLVFNFSPASIFLGDAGALSVGLVLGVLGIEASHLASTSHVTQALIPVLVMLVPLIDICSVVVRRLLNGVSIAHRGLDHTHHRLALLGLSPGEVVWVTYALAALGGLCAWALHAGA